MPQDHEGPQSLEVNPAPPETNPTAPLLRIVAPDDATPEAAAKPTLYERSEIRDFVGVNAPSGTAIGALMASTVQLESLMASLVPGEQLVAHLDFATPGSSGLSVEIIAAGKSRREVSERGSMLGGILDAALATGLPCVDIAPITERRTPVRLPHKRLLAPAGTTLPLATETSKPRPQAANKLAGGGDDREDQRRDSVVFSPSATGTHLAGLSAAMNAIATKLSIDVRMSRTLFDAPLLKQITVVRARIGDRLHADASKYVRDPRYAEADKQLEHLQLAGAGIHFEVLVRSKRPLHDMEVSALSAALFGSPHDDNQHGHLSTLRSIYPHDDAVASFFGILAAAVGPAIERRHINALDALDGNVIGTVKSGHKVRMAVASPRSHTYVIGRPGSGKSTLLLNLIHQDMLNGDSVVLIDPHGDLWADVRDRVPAARRKDLMLIHMGDPALQPQLNLFDLGPGDPAEARARVVDTCYQLVRRLMYSGLTIDATGPLFNKYFRAALMLLLEAEGSNATIDQFETVFADSDYRDELRMRDSVSKQTCEQWEQILAVRGNEHTIEGLTPWITSKLAHLTQSAILKPILNTTKTSFTFDQVLAENKICLINLANGSIGTEAAGLLGGILTHRLEQAAKRQSCMVLEDRRKASVYFDEFHTFASEFLRPLMAETRKYGLRVTLANQTLSQMINNDISGGVFREVLGNCANTIVFAVDVEDARYLAPRFGGKIDPVQLVAQPNYQAICQFQTKSAALGPFTVKTPPPPDVENDPPF